MGFNPRTRVGCDAGDGAVCRQSVGFNPRTRVGCDLCPNEGGPPVVCFNPRTRVGCDDVVVREYVPLEWVSIHAPAWGATGVDGKRDLSMTLFQSTHPRGVRLLQALRQAGVEGVSIHAPAWGATLPLSWRRYVAHVSIHAPAWGATQYRMDLSQSLSSFNPRTRVGCDCEQVATRAQDDGFNPRTRVGCDTSTHHPAADSVRFQSTHPRGVRRQRGKDES